MVMVKCCFFSFGGGVSYDRCWVRLRFSIKGNDVSGIGRLCVMWMNILGGCKCVIVVFLII